jgi:hypothetical protein
MVWKKIEKWIVKWKVRMVWRVWRVVWVHEVQKV